MKLRPYQKATVAHAEEWISRANPDRRPVIIAPTGSGKSVMLAAIAQGFPGRVMVAAPTEEIVSGIEQAFKSLGESPSVFCASLNRREISGRVVIGTVASLEPHKTNFDGIGLLIIDEAHLVQPQDRGRYSRLCAHLRIAEPGLLVLGASATPYRIDHGLIYEGDGAMFNEILDDIPIDKLMADGYLSPLVSKPGSVQIDTLAVRRGASGDFVTSALESAAMAGDVTEKAIAEVVNMGQGRRSWLVFAVTLVHARRCLAALRRHGVDAEMIDGTTASTKRDELVCRFRDGALQALVNVDVLALGFDAPITDLIAILRPTASTGRYVQICGRGLRLADGKRDCLVLDYGGNIARHGPINRLDVKHVKTFGAVAREPEALAAPPKTKECPTCSTEMPSGARLCKACGHVFGEVSPFASTDPILVMPDGAVPRVGQFSAATRMTLQRARELVGR